MTADKPWSAACERNRDPILAVLREHLRDGARVLEIGSGTGQHAAHFAAHLPAVTWQASDRAENLPGIRAWLDEAALPNAPAPFAFDVSRGPWPTARYDAVFTANTLHIMGWRDVEALFAGLPSIATRDATLIVYGPFNVGGRFTSPSNAAFDAALRADAPERGIRDLEAVDALARRAGLAPIADVEMPANNRCLVWRAGREGA